ncbi:hypothetical protein BLOT_007397 [Blomia tropicalis]|nr:hypothetical protein BLOT_007397 [Blomia tropicalis]
MFHDQSSALASQVCAIQIFVLISMRTSIGNQTVLMVIISSWLINQFAFRHFTPIALNPYLGLNSFGTGF